MSHRGEILEKIFKDTGLKVTPIARKMGIDRGTIYRHFNEADLSIDYIVKYGKAMKIDMQKYFPEVVDIVSNEDGHLLFEKPSYAELENAVNHWKDKYIQLLERYNDLLLEKK